MLKISIEKPQTHRSAKDLVEGDTAIVRRVAPTNTNGFFKSGDVVILHRCYIYNLTMLATGRRCPYAMPESPAADGVTFDLCEAELTVK